MVWILTLGLEAAGKTTVKLGEMMTTIATIASKVETVEHKDCLFTVWSVKVQDKFPPSVASSPPAYERSDLCCRQ